MATRKKVPADVAALKSIIQEQSVKIVELEKQLKDKTQSLEYAQSNSKSAGEKAVKLEDQIEEIHGLIDSIPGVLPRTTTIPPKNSYSHETQRENSIMLRLASFMGARS